MAVSPDCQRLQFRPSSWQACQTGTCRFSRSSRQSENRCTYGSRLSCSSSSPGLTWTCLQRCKEPLISTIARGGRLQDLPNCAMKDSPAKCQQSGFQDTPLSREFLKRTQRRRDRRKLQGRTRQKCYARAARALSAPPCERCTAQQHYRRNRTTCTSNIHLGVFSYRCDHTTRVLLMDVVSLGLEARSNDYHIETPPL